MDFAFFVILGIFAGALASVFTKTETFPGFLMDVILGVFGAIMGGILLYLSGQPTDVMSQFDGYSFVLAAVGALIWIGVGNTLKLT